MYKKLEFTNTNLNTFVLGGFFMLALLLFIAGGTVGFFAAALCKAAGRADEEMENLERRMEKLK